MNIYYGLFYSHISYNISLWGNSIDLNRVLLTQKRVLRLIFNLKPMDSCKPLFVSRRIMTVTCIYIYKCLLYVRENKHKFTKLSDYHHYDTRNGEVLCIPKHRLAKYESSPSYQGIKFFNHLPKTVRSLNLSSFKKCVKNILLQEAFYSVGDYFNTTLKEF